VAISRHLEAAKFTGFWASNADIVPYFTCRIGGDETSPKLAGTNSLRHHTSCALIYSAKATPDDEAIIKALGLSREDIQTAREDEDVYQFICRGAIRDPDYSGDYAVYLYDRGQAERLRDRLIATGYTVVSTEPVIEAGILDVVRPHHSRGGKLIAAAAPETAAERDARLKAQDAQRKRESRRALRDAKIADGTYKGPGRPEARPSL
jgi:Lon protease-like protein